LDDATVGVTDRLIVEHVNLTLGRGDRVWLSGANGSGKTTLVRALLEQARVPGEKILYLPQDLSVEEEARTLTDLRTLSGVEKGRVLSLVAALGVEPDRLLATNQPSPGEARKLLIAEGLGRHVWVLVLDEPTNHLDLPGIERLEIALRAYPGSLILVTHDQRFAQRAGINMHWILADGALRNAAD